MPNQEYKVPAELLNPIKEALIKIGYANATTPLSFVQDAYYKYIMIRQTGFNPHIPYALGLLPKELQDQLGGTDPEVPVELATPTIIELVAQGSMIIAQVSVVYTDPLAKPASLNVRAFNDSLGFNSFSDTVSDPVSGEVYEFEVTNVTAGEISVYANAGSSDGESSKQSSTGTVTVGTVTPVPFDMLNITKDGFAVSPIPKGGAYWSTSTGQTGNIEYSDGTGSGVFNPPLNTNTYLNIESLDGTRKQQKQWLTEMAFDTIEYNQVTGELIANTISARPVVGTNATVKYTISGTPHTINLTASVDKLTLTGTLDPLAVDNTELTIEDPDARLKTVYTVILTGA